MTATTPVPCSVCGKPVNPKYRPFCSKRCADIDLNRWLGGQYAVPVSESEDEVWGSDALASEEEVERP